MRMKRGKKNNKVEENWKKEIMKETINNFKLKLFSLYLNNLKKLTDSFIEADNISIKN
jgi:hypothetical protein